MRRAAAARPHPAGELPAVNTTAVLELHPDGPFLPTRVEDLVGGVLLVSAAGHLGPLPERQRVTVGWAVPRGACSVLCELTEVLRGSPPLWALLPVAPVQRSQRRRFVRGTLLGSVELAAPAADLASVLGGTGPAAGRDGHADGTGPPGELLPARVTGDLVDVCEGGAQVRTSADGAGVLEGEEVRLLLDVAGRRAELVATVVRNRPDASGHRLVGLVFDADEATADAIRAEVLRTQIEGRARAREQSS